MTTGEMGNPWGITDAIKSDVAGIKVTLARLEERGANRDVLMANNSNRLESMESKLQKLDIKLAAAIGGVTLIAWAFQLLAPVL